MDAQKIYERLITRAATRAGGMEPLAARLKLPCALLQDWLDGRQAPDSDTVLRLLEIALDG